MVVEGSVNWNPEEARRYHEATKHTFVSVRMPGRGLDWENRPYPFKVYLDAEKIRLPAGFGSPPLDLISAITSQQRRTERLNLSELAGLLFYSAGITRIYRYPFGGRYYFRAYPSTGALYQTELYVVAGDVSGLEPGVYHFDPGQFVLSVIRRGDYRSHLSALTGHDGVVSCDAAVVLTSVAWRNAWKYGARSYRHWFWDGGTLCANLISTAGSLGLGWEVLVGFVDDLLNGLLGIDGRREAAIAVVPLWSGHASRAGPSPEVGEVRHRVLPLSRREVEYEEVTRAYASSRLLSAEEVSLWRKRASSMTDVGARHEGRRLRLPGPPDGLALPPLGDVILRRGSTRRFSRVEIEAWKLGFVLRSMSVPLKTDFLGNQGSLVSVFAIVNGVEGVPSGSYLYDRLTGELVLLREGRFRRTAEYLCLEQELGGDASATLFLMSPLDAVLSSLGNRGYRASQFEAGIRVGLAYLAAHSVGIGATGLTFYDDDVREFFSPASSEMECMMVVALGVPAYKPKPGSVHIGAVEHPVR
ncbi:MAG: SagB/ThcOx family dehydrogenase [Nitrososphaerota archaeon]